jgi:hypothetical protein
MSVVAKGLSYADAVRLLGGQGNGVVAALDRLCGGVLLAVAASGGGFALSLLGARTELARLSGELVSGLDKRVHGVSRFSRSERLAAAHSVVVLAAYFESFDRAGLPIELRDLELGKAGQAALATGGSSESRLAAALLRANVPAPAPQWPFERTLEKLRDFYAQLSEEVSRFLTGLAVWDRLDDTRRDWLRRVLVEELPDRAVARYQEEFRRLAGSFPEFAFWANQIDHQATRAQLERSLAGLERMLAELAAGREPTAQRAALAKVYRAALDKPILTVGDGPQGLRIPPLGEAYINPDFRVAEVGAADRLAEESWWKRHRVRDDLQGFLVGHLTSRQATGAPLLLLGQPGSGKSVLTKVLAARLPANEFLVVRVPLREVPADADVQTQIEHAVRAATGEDLRWPELARTAGDALPVVLLDGFDELLQATGVSQSDYLEQVATFQSREADLDRSVAIIVTSRTAVADRTRSLSGMVAIRLEPFHDRQIAQWLDVWNATNAGHLAARALDPLPVESVLPHAELAAQPLLLLMLAVYDADGNALQRTDRIPLRHGELYDRLLIRFAEREVGKAGPALAGEELRRAVEWELTRLSVAAFAMFNRNRQWVTEAELNADLSALLGGTAGRSTTSLRAELSAAEVIIGRFFFVHEAQASRDGAQLKTYEFLHATFGEYLISRLVVQELVELANTAELGASRGRPSPVDDSFLCAVLSFAALSTRGTAVSFIAEQVAELPEIRRHRICDVLLGLFHIALEPRQDTKYGAYRPTRLGVPAEYAAHSANLIILVVLVAGEVSGADLFPKSGDPVSQWRRMTFLWQSQLSSEGWNQLVHTIAVDREWDGDRRTIRLMPSQLGMLEPVDPFWTYNHPKQTNLDRWRHYDFADLRLHSNFKCERTDDTVMHALEPFTGFLDQALCTMVRLPDGRAVSPARALIKLLVASGSNASVDGLVPIYEACLIALSRLSDAFPETRTIYRRMIHNQFVADHERLGLPIDWFVSAETTIELDAATKPSRVNPTASHSR